MLPYAFYNDLNGSRNHFYFLILFFSGKKSQFSLVPRAVQTSKPTTTTSATTVSSSTSNTEASSSATTKSKSNADFRQFLLKK